MTDSLPARLLAEVPDSDPDRDPGPMHPAHRGLTRKADVLAKLEVVGARKALVLEARRLGVTQQEIADTAHITTKTIRTWEKESQS